MGCGCGSSTRAPFEPVLDPECSAKGVRRNCEKQPVVQQHNAAAKAEHEEHEDAAGELGHQRVRYILRSGRGELDECCTE